MPVINRPVYKMSISSAKPMQTQPIKNGTLLNCIDLRLPNHSANNPDRTAPIGLVTAPKLAGKKNRNQTITSSIL